MDGILPYIECFAALVALYLLLGRGGRGAKALGILGGFAALAWIYVTAGNSIVGGEGVGREVLFLIFGAIAISAAVRMITHSRPVYSAINFVFVVLSSAGLFLLLEAEFMAFALVIVYAGAVLITYMFVLMLAQQASSPDKVTEVPEYDRVAREPAAAVTVGFIFLATIFGAIYQGIPSMPPPAGLIERNVARAEVLQGLPKHLRAAVEESAPTFQWPPELDGNKNMVHADDQGIYVVGTTDAGSHQTVRLPKSAGPRNTQFVGWDLVARFPASLEIAGVILLLAMFGAVILARRQIEHGEDELREAVGLTRIHDWDDDPSATEEGSSA
ncbi:MAG: NADH-quinone oxidoreductase subunit J [Planctomycetota bacterium]|nr:NADH-quinone oxidoreductase subunit J [Planctomycetota bacterium]